MTDQIDAGSRIEVEVSDSGARQPFVRERLALDQLDYPIAPSSNRLAYMLGGLTFSGLLLLIVTGILLDQFYNPNPVGAHDSVVYIMTRVLPPVAPDPPCRECRGMKECIRSSRYRDRTRPPK